MRKQLPISAADINDAHQCAQESAANAVEHAIRCGQLLLAKQDQVGHGGFHAWIEANCDFALSTAKRYITAAKKKATGVAVPSLSGIFPSGQPGAKSKSDSPKGAVSVLKPKGTEETGADRPAAPVSHPAPAPKATQKQQSEPELLQKTAEIAAAPTSDDDEPERPDDIDEDAALAVAEADYLRRVDAVMQSDDKMAEAKAQLKQQAALIGTLETTRDGYMRGKDAVTKMLQAEQRKVAKLEKENKALRERLAIVEGKAA
jgi:hypothetical protein